MKYMPKRNFSKKHFALLSFGFVLLVFFWVRNNPFFWDTVVLGGKQGHWFYETTFSNFFLPEEINSGHPPLLGFYLALVWSVFGKSLFVSHLSMIVFQWGILWQLYRIAYFFTKNNTAIILPLLAIADPVLMGQFVLISPDVLLVFFFLLALNSIFRDLTPKLNSHKILLALAAMGLAMVSLRGMMVVMILYVFELFQTFIIDKKEFSIRALFQKAIVYIPSGLLAILFLWTHYQHNQWIGYNLNSRWAENFQTNDFSGIIRNTLILGWRLVDFGRIFVWLGVFGIVFISYKNKISLFKNKEIKTLAGLLFLSLTFFYLNFIRYQGLAAHRYLLPVFMVLSIFLFVLIFKFVRTQKSRAIIWGIVILGLFSGNLWIYPEKIAQGWDATLAHVPYYGLRKKMFDYIERENIDVTKIGSAFPETGAFKYRDLSDRTEGFVEKDFEKNTYIFYSNVMNNFSDTEIDLLHSEWKIVQSFEKRGIWVHLYKK